MTRTEIEHMWKVASNNPNHDTNWHDPVVINFAKLVVAHTLSIIDPSKFMSYQEGLEAGRLAEREACAKVADEHMRECEGKGFGVGAAIRARSNT
jgi:hypothetical protein